MSGSSHQTVRIARGRHRAPSEGACVMELASMLAGEEFSDRPRCVDPVLAAYLRAFNDRLSHADRQRLYPYAALAVGTRAGRRTARARRDLCLAYAGLRPGPAARVRVAFLLRARLALRFGDGAAEYAARHAIAAGDVEGGFGLIDALLAEGGTRGRPNEAAPAPEPVVA